MESFGHALSWLGQVFPAICSVLMHRWDSHVQRDRPLGNYAVWVSNAGLCQNVVLHCFRTAFEQC